MDYNVTVRGADTDLHLLTWKDTHDRLSEKTNIMHGEEKVEGEKPKCEQWLVISE